MGQALGGSEATKKLKRAQLPHASNKRGNDQCRCWGPNATIQLLGRLIEAIQQEKGARRLIEERRSAGERSTKRTHQQRPKRFFFPPFFRAAPRRRRRLQISDRRRGTGSQRKDGRGMVNRMSGKSVDRTMDWVLGCCKGSGRPAHTTKRCFRAVGIQTKKRRSVRQPTAHMLRSEPSLFFLGGLATIQQQCVCFLFVRLFVLDSR